jgi:hypothetical protein
VIEDRVVTNVASYGRQLGWLAEITIALADDKPPPEKTLRRLKEAFDAIEAIKKEVQLPALDAASKALDRLERDDPEAYKRLLQERRRGGRTEG